MRDDTGASALGEFFDKGIQEECTDHGENEEAEGFPVEFDAGEDGKADTDHQQHGIPTKRGKVTHGFFEDTGAEQSLGGLGVTEGGDNAFIERSAGSIEEGIDATEADGDEQYADECGGENFEQRRVKHAAIISGSRRLVAARC